MPQRPSGLSKVARTRKPAEIPPEPRTAPGNPIPWTGRAGWNGYAKGLENHPAANTPASTGGEGVPNVSPGRECRMCRAYAIDPEWHEQWHKNLDAWAREKNEKVADMERFIQQLGYVPNGGDSTASDGNSGEVSS